MKNPVHSTLLIGIILSGLFAVSAGAVPFEKAIMFSGKYSGTAGSATGIASGAEALYFNPAGLAGRKGGETTLNFSPTIAKFSGPIAAANTSVESKTPILPLGGFFASYGVNEKLAFGAGYYTAGGSRADFGNVDVSGANAAYLYKPEIKTDLQITEFSLGGAYEVFEGLKLGAAWRATYVKADFNFAALSSSVAIQMKDLTDSQYDGYRLGALYESKDKNWGIGASYRSNVSFKATGKVTSQLLTTGASLTTSNTGSIASNFPEEFKIGGFYDFGSFRLVPEFDSIRYETTNRLNISATVAGSAVANLPLNSNPMNIYRLGAELPCSDSLVFRGGYALTTQVMPNNRAAAALPAPSMGNLFTLGAGKNFASGLSINAAVEYGYLSGSVSSIDASQATADGATLTKQGSYSTALYSMHTGISYQF